MASTDSVPPLKAPGSEPAPSDETGTDRDAVISALGPSDLTDLVALSAASHWNQNADDWQWMLSAGRARGIRRHGQVIASTLVLPWPSTAHDPASRQDHTPLQSPAWISMVLVRPDHRGQSFARRLLQESLDWLDAPEQGHLIPVLDATPAGRTIYLQAGFQDCWTFTRWQGHGSGLPNELTNRELIIEGIARSGDLAKKPSAFEAISSLDRLAFGADRRGLLSDLIARAPSLALRASQAQHLNSPIGFVLGRPGSRATQIGPIVAQDAATALALLSAALERVEGPVFVDVPDHCAAMVTALQAAGFSAQRPFTRMLRGPAEGLPGDRALTWAIAGPELG